MVRRRVHARVVQICLPADDLAEVDGNDDGNDGNQSRLQACSGNHPRSGSASGPGQLPHLKSGRSPVRPLQTRKSKGWLGGQNLMVTAADGVQYGFGVVGVSLYKWWVDLVLAFDDAVARSAPRVGHGSHPGVQRIRAKDLISRCRAAAATTRGRLRSSGGRVSPLTTR